MLFIKYSMCIAMTSLKLMTAKNLHMALISKTESQIMMVLMKIEM